MGRAMTSQWEDRKQPEWPPHPQRLFSAMVAANGELDLGASGEAALKWLERLPPPQIRADLNPAVRSSVGCFVPVNDEAVRVHKGGADFRHVANRRNRQERFFPAVTPADPVVTFQWPAAPQFKAHRRALGHIVENLTYLGHSASPVRACLRSEAVEPTLSPASDGDYVLRIPGPGRFDRLNDVHRLRSTDETIQPPLGRVERYGRPVAPSTNEFSSDALVLALGPGPRLGLDSSLPLMQFVRLALLSYLGPSAPEVLTGHDSTGGMSETTHLAFMPLAFVNSRFADGFLKGVALVLPTGVDASTRRRLLSALANLRQLHLGPLGSIAVRLLDRSSRELDSLNFTAYTEPSLAWASVTPMVLDRHPKRNGSNIAVIVADSCERSGLPRPVEVRVSHISAIAGVPPVREFHGRSKQVDSRLRRHLWIRFAHRVGGPVLIGAGRYIGLGVCIPSSAR